MKTNLIVVRHGETEWNRAQRQQGHLDSPLTDLGIRQAEAMAEGLREHPVDHCYCSDLGRAAETAEIITKALGRQFIVDRRLRERHLGILQGITRKEFAEKHPADFRRLHEYDPDFRIPEGESIRERYARNISGLEEIAEKHHGASVLIVAHGGLLMSCIHKALDIPLCAPRSYSLYNGAINAFGIAEGKKWTMELWGDIGHLKSRGLGTLDDN